MTDNLRRLEYRLGASGLLEFLQCVSQRWLERIIFENTLKSVDQKVGYFFRTFDLSFDVLYHFQRVGLALEVGCCLYLILKFIPGGLGLGLNDLSRGNCLMVHGVILNTQIVRVYDVVELFSRQFTVVYALDNLWTVFQKSLHRLLETDIGYVHALPIPPKQIAAFE